MTTKRTKTRGARHELEAIHGEPLSLGNLVAAIRQGEDWSLAEMAKRLKVTRAHVAAIENGKPVSPQRAAKYAKALGYSEAQFVRLALQDEIRRAGLRYRIELSAGL